MVYDVIIVGAGASGCPLAARLSEDAHRSVLLLEAGPVPSKRAETPKELLDAGTVQGAMPGHPNNWSFPSRLTPVRPYTIARGRILGGSTSISGGYFIRARREDFDRWSSGDNHEWRWDRVFPLYRRLENDLQYGESAVHGGGGPMIISRPAQDHPSTMAFAAAAKELGYVFEQDKNDQGQPGYGPLPMNCSLTGGRLSAGEAYINPIRDRRNLTVLGNRYVRRILFEGIRAVGVEASFKGEVETFHAKEIILSAGAVKTPHILLVSGIGPKKQLEGLGINIVRDLPVGRDFSDHPSVALAWRPKRAIIDNGRSHAFADVLNFTSKDSSIPGDLEILPAIKPIDYLLTGKEETESRADTPSLHQRRILSKVLWRRFWKGTPSRKRRQSELFFLVSLQAETSRGQLTLESKDPDVHPLLDFNYLSTDSDLARLREAVRCSVKILQSRAYRNIFKDLAGVSLEVVSNDDLLNEWIKSHLGTSIHMCGTAKLGSPSDPMSVVDQYGRVHGVQSLRVADTSILPTAPTRGPAATAVLVGELIADFIRRESALSPESATSVVGES